MVDRIAIHVSDKCVKALRQGEMKREEILLRALLELHQDMQLNFTAKELNDLHSYRNLEEIKICSKEESIMS